MKLGSAIGGAAPQWDAEVLARVAWLQLRARQAVTGLIHGAHRSVQIASNVEFAEYKEYSPGDPLRDLDWRVAARSDRLVVRRHRAESDLPVIIVFDASGDMSTGEGGLGRPPLQGSKFGYSVTLAASLAWFLSHRGEPVGLLIAGGEEPHSGGVRPPRWPYIPARTGETHLVQLLAALAALRPAGQANLGRAFEETGQRMRRRGVVAVVSDLMEEPTTWGPSLSALARRQADLRVVHLHDEREWAFDFKAPARFWSPEGGEPLPLDPNDVREALPEVLREYLAEVRGWLAGNRAVHVLTPTRLPLELALARVLRGHAGDPPRAP